jgi:carbon-monoxide dehydrogenase large subunit
MTERETLRAGERLVGRPVPPAANARFVSGRGDYTDDEAPAGALHMTIVRSPHASARILAIDTSAALAAPGVLAVLTGEDAAADGLGPLRSLIERRRANGARHAEPEFPILARGEVNHVGFPVVAIVADTLAHAQDAAEAVAITYEERPAITRTRDLLKPDAPIVWEGMADNICFVHEAGDAAAVARAFGEAARVVSVDVDITRVSANPMENRNAVGTYDARSGRYILRTGTQMPHGLRAELARSVLRIPESELRVISPDIGGAFGLKIAATPEQALVLWAARRTGRPVRWQATRSEAFASDWHARDMVSKVELALDRDGRFLALKVESLANLGACLCANTLHSPVANLGGLAGPYRTPAIFVRVTGAFSNANPTGPYRGAGRPEVTYALERVIDTAARQLGLSPVELRRRNLIPPDAFPFRTGLIFTYDSGEFGKAMDMALELADWKGFAKRRGEAARRGALRGIGIANAIEIAGGPAGAPLEEFMEVRLDAAGHATVTTGLHSHGQGLETVLPQVLHDELGLALEKIRLRFGDTDIAYHGHGAGGSRSAAAGSVIAIEAARRIVEKGRLIAAHALEAATADIAFENGVFRVAGTDRSVTLTEVARISFDRMKMPDGVDLGLAAAVVKAPTEANFPNGCHVCEVEIDRETGTPTIVGYWAVEDVGRVLNPLVVEGQIHGGVAQGLGQALMELISHDPESGQLITGSFLDYSMPRADTVPGVVTRFNPVPTNANPLGVKGAGEAGTVGALPAIINAINDALAFAGAGEIEMPATSQRIWKALREATPAP